MKYNVHLYAVVRVKVPDVEAESQKEAIEKAEAQVDLYSTFDWEGLPINGGIVAFDYAEEIAYYLVDEHGDEEYLDSKWWHIANGELKEGATPNES